MPLAPADARSDDGLTRTEAGILGLLAWGGGGSGYDLTARARRSVGFVWAPTRSQMYVVLPRLAGRGLIDGTSVPQDGRPDKVHYAISTRGREVLAAWVAADEAPEPEDRDGMLLKVFFASLGPEGAVEAQLRRFSARVAARLEDYRAIERGLVTEPEEPGPLAALRLGIALTEATQAWCAATLGDQSPWSGGSTVTLTERPSGDQAGERS